MLTLYHEGMVFLLVGVVLLGVLIESRLDNTD